MIMLVPNANVTHRDYDGGHFDDLNQQSAPEAGEDTETEGADLRVQEAAAGAQAGGRASGAGAGAGEKPSAEAEE